MRFREHNSPYQPNIGVSEIQENSENDYFYCQNLTRTGWVPLKHIRTIKLNFHFTFPALNIQNGSFMINARRETQLVFCSINSLPSQFPRCCCCSSTRGGNITFAKICKTSSFITIKTNISFYLYFNFFLLVFFFMGLIAFKKRKKHLVTSLNPLVYLFLSLSLLYTWKRGEVSMETTPQTLKFYIAAVSVTTRTYLSAWGGEWRRAFIRRAN